MSTKTAKKAVKTKRKVRKNVPVGVAHVQATFNNTIITITDLEGEVISWSSTGKAKFAGSRKSSSFAATVAGQDAGKSAAALGVQEVGVKLRGPGTGRESAVRGLQSAGLSISYIQDETPVAHNGCRPKKRRRV